MAKYSSAWRLLLTGTHIAVFATIGGSTYAQQPQSREFTHQIVNGKKVAKPWSEIVGKRVQAEGLAWGAFEKGLGPRVILDHVAISVRGVDFVKRDLNGKTVRVEGILRVEHARAAPVGAQGRREDIWIYHIDAERVEPIERVEWPWLQESLPSNRAK